jgi:hypothetical protein
MAALYTTPYVTSNAVASTFFTLPSKKPRQVFVAYPYKLYPTADYRPVGQLSSDWEKRAVVCCGADVPDDPLVLPVNLFETLQ